MRKLNFKHKKKRRDSATLEVDYGLSLILTCYVVSNDPNNNYIIARNRIKSK